METDGPALFWIDPQDALVLVINEKVGTPHPDAQVRYEPDGGAAFASLFDRLALSYIRQSSTLRTQYICHQRRSGRAFAEIATEMECSVRTVQRLYRTHKDEARPVAFQHLTVPDPVPPWLRNRGRRTVARNAMVIPMTTESD